MGFRYRKSINLGGGFRVNLSKSGIGYSWGTKGYRVTKKAGGGVRKTYSIPGTGLSWSEDSGKSRKNSSSNLRVTLGNQYVQQPTLSQPVIYEATDVNTKELVSEQTKEFITAIKKYCQIHGILKWGIIITGVIMFSAPPVVVLFIAFLAGMIYHANTSKIRVEYEFDEYGTRRIQMLDQAMSELMNNGSVWQIVTKVANSSVKTNAGASSSVNRKLVKFIKKKPYFLKTDATCYNIKLQNDNIFIMPDRIIVKGKKGWGAIEYAELDITVASQIFIEDGEVPKDAEVVGYTWQYVNKNGGPDKRYKNNRQLPKCNYGALSITSRNALNILLYISSVNHAKSFLNIVNKMIAEAEQVKKLAAEEIQRSQQIGYEDTNSLNKPVQIYEQYEDHDDGDMNQEDEKSNLEDRMINALKSSSYESFLPDGVIEDEETILKTYWEGLKGNNLALVTSCSRKSDGSIEISYKGTVVGSFYIRNKEGWLIHNIGNNGKINRVEGNMDDLTKNVTKWHRYIINYL